MRRLVRVWGAVFLASTPCVGCVDAPRVDPPCDVVAAVQWVHPLAPTGDANVLSEGFEVPGVRLQREDDGSFSLPVATSAVYLTCAAFRCRPQIGAAATDRAENELFAAPSRILNFDECVVAYDHFVSEHPRIYTDQLRTLPQASVCEDSAVSPEQGDSARASARWLGCWVYGGAGVIEASDLRAVEAPADAPTLRDDCLDHDDGPMRLIESDKPGCQLDDDSIGICVDGECRPWCAQQACPNI